MRATSPAWNIGDIRKLNQNCRSKYVRSCVLYEERLLASSCLFVRLSVCLFLCPHGTTRLPLDGFLWNLIFEDFFFRKYVEKFWRFADRASQYIYLMYITNLMHKICFTVSFISHLYMFRAHVLIIRRSKLHYTASGIITPIGGRPVHRLREDCSPLSTCALGV